MQVLTGLCPDVTILHDAENNVAWQDRTWATNTYHLCWNMLHSILNIACLGLGGKTRLVPYTPKTCARKCALCEHNCLICHCSIIIIIFFTVINVVTALVQTAEIS